MIKSASENESKMEFSYFCLNLSHESVESNPRSERLSGMKLVYTRLFHQTHARKLRDKGCTNMSVTISQDDQNIENFITISTTR